jgi:hypothetical protein
MCYVEAKHSSSAPISHIYGSNAKVTITKSTKSEPASQYVHTNAKICKSWNMFNSKKLFKLQIRPSSLILLITYPRIGECFTAEGEVRHSMTMMIIIIIIIIIISYLYFII